MPLKPVYDSLDAVPDEHKSLYSERSDGKAVLELDGLPPGAVQKERLDEFRATNVDLLKKNETLTAEIEKMKESLAELDELRKKLDAKDDDDLLKAGKVDELVEQKLERRVAEMRREHETAIKALTKARDENIQARETAETGLYGLMIDQGITNAIGDVAVPRKGAWPDLRARARSVWRVKEGSMVPMDEDGQVLYGPDGEKPLTMQQWIEGMVDSAPHLFEDSSGAGGPGNKKPVNTNGAKRIVSGDPVAFGANLEGIAKGTVQVVSN